MTVAYPQLEWVKPPRQARSQKTLERILDAAEALIGETGAVSFTVSEVAKRARSSVGSLYARFRGKEALLRSVFERFLEQAMATVEDALTPARWRGAPMVVIVESAVAFAVRVFDERRPLIAAFTLAAAREPDMSALAERLAMAAADRLLVLARERRDQLGHPEPEIALPFLTWAVFSALEAHTLHRSVETSRPEPDQLVAEMTRMCSAYLGLSRHNGVAASPGVSPTTPAPR